MNDNIFYLGSFKRVDFGVYLWIKTRDMDYELADFDKCRYNPLRGIKGSKDIDEIYSELRDRRGFFVGHYSLHTDRNKVLRWIMALYQPESPMIQDYPDYRVRRVRAGMIFGFDLEPGEASRFTEEYQGIIGGQNNKVNGSILEFCRLMRDDDYTELKIYQDKLYDLFGRLQNLDQGKDEKVILDNISLLKGRIADLKKKFMVDDGDLGVAEALLDMMDVDYVEMSREAIVRRIEAGEDIFGGRYVPPYGSDYVKKFYKDVNRERFLNRGKHQ